MKTLDRKANFPLPRDPTGSVRWLCSWVAVAFGFGFRRNPAVTLG
jgi:hypothetical protein